MFAHVESSVKSFLEEAESIEHLTTRGVSVDGVDAVEVLSYTEDSIRKVCELADARQVTLWVDCSEDHEVEPDVESIDLDLASQAYWFRQLGFIGTHFPMRRLPK